MNPVMENVLSASANPADMPKTLASGSSDARYGTRKFLHGNSANTLLSLRVLLSDFVLISLRWIVQKP